MKAQRVPREVIKVTNLKKNSIKKIRIKKVNYLKKDKNLYNYLVEFANESTIHGVNYTVNTKYICEKIFWLIVILIAFWGGIKLGLIFYNKHEKASMQTLIINPFFPSTNIKLPAVTICPSTMISKKQYQNYLKTNKNLKWPKGVNPKVLENSLHYVNELLQPTNVFEKELEPLKMMMELNSISSTDLFKDLSPQCDEMMLICLFEEEVRDCKSLFNRSFTNYGPCCSFNYKLIPEKQSYEPLEPIFSTAYGTKFFLSVLIKPLPIEDKLSSSLIGSGIRVIIHDCYTYPGVSSIFTLASSGNEIICTLNSKKTVFSKEVRQLTPKQRHCYVSPKTSIYRANNRYLACQEKNYKKHCGCVPFYASVIQPSDSICNLSHIPCFIQHKEAFKITFNDEKCNTLPDCANFMYEMEGSTISLDAPKFNPSIFYQTASKHPGATAIHVTFTSQWSVLQRRDVILSWIDAVSSIGGIFSLCIGCSFISLCEVFFFLINILWKYYRIKRKQKKVQFAFLH